MNPPKPQNVSSVEALVLQAREGDTRAYDQLVSLYADRIYNYVARMVHDPIEAEDIAQEAFIKAFRNLPSFRGASTFQTWLYRIAANLTIDSVRRRRRRENTCSLDAPLDTEEGSMAREQEDFHEPGPQRSLEVDELRRQVHKAIRQLSPKLRRVMILYELQGLSYEEIADAVGCPLGTVESRIFNARISLRMVLEATQARREEDDLALRPNGRRKKGAGAAKTAQNPAATIHTLRRQVRGWLENATWNNGYKGMDVDILVAETYRRADTWVVAFEGQGRVRFLEEWLKRIAELVAGLAIEELKRQRLQEAVSDCADLTDLDAGLPDGSGQSIDDLLAARSDIAALLTSLPDDLRIAYGLKVVCNSSNKQIADAIGVQAANVRGKLAQARELLTEALSREADQLGAAVHATLEAGGEGLSKAKGGGVAIMAGQLARDVEGLPLTPKQGETLYQNWARTVEGGSEQDVARWVAKFGANSPDEIFKRCRCSDPHRPDVISQMPMIDPSQPASRVAGIGWLNVEVGDLSIYALEEKLSREGDDSHKALLELYYLLGCSNGEEFAARLDYDKIPSSSNEGKGHTEEQGQTLAGEGSAETSMAPPRTNGGRPASELGGELIAKLAEKPEPDMTLKDYEMGLTGPDRKKLYEALDFGDEDDFDEWKEKEYDPKWKPAYLTAAKGGGSASEAQAATQPDRQEEEAVQTGPFTDLAEFAGKALSEAGMNRLAETPISLWGIDKPGTLAQFLLFAYKKGEAKDGKGLVPLIQLVTSPMFDGKLPMNADSDEFFRMAIAERTRQSKEAKAGDGAGTAASGSQTTTSHAPATGTSGTAPAPAGAATPATAGQKKEEHPVSDNWFASQEIKGATNWSKMYNSPANMVAGGEEGTLIELLVRTADEAGKGNGAKALTEFYEQHKDRLPSNIDGAGLTRAVQSYLSRQKKAAGGSAAPKKAAPKKAAPKSSAEKGADDVKVARRALVIELCSNKAVGDYSIESCLPEGWPVPTSSDQIVTNYMVLLKGAGISSEDVAAFIADQIGHADHQLEVVELYDELATIAPEPAPQPAPTPAPTPMPRPAPMAEGIVVAAHLGRPMTELELALAEFVVQSGLVNEDDLLFQFLRQRQDVLADLSRYMIEKVAASAPEASEEAIAVLGRRLEQFMRDFILPAKAVAEAETA